MVRCGAHSYHEPPSRQECTYHVWLDKSLFNAQAVVSGLLVVPCLEQVPLHDLKHAPALQTA